MNIAIVLAAGVGQRMRNGGLPKQFLKLMGKPIIIYTLEKFEICKEIDKIVIVCHGSYIEYMKEILNLYQLKKIDRIIVGGSTRQSSLKRGLNSIVENTVDKKDIVLIHDGVRPLVSLSIIQENIRVAKQYGCAVTVHPVTESVVITESAEVEMADFKKRAETYSLTAPQTFQIGRLIDAYEEIDRLEEIEMPLLDAAMVYAYAGNKIYLVKEQEQNIKITTPEDFYMLKAILELEENKYVFGL